MAGWGGGGGGLQRETHSRDAWESQAKFHIGDVKTTQIWVVNLIGSYVSHDGASWFDGNLTHYSRTHEPRLNHGWIWIIGLASCSLHSPFLRWAGDGLIWSFAGRTWLSRDVRRTTIARRWERKHQARCDRSDFPWRLPKHLIREGTLFIGGGGASEGNALERRLRVTGKNSAYWWRRKYPRSG